jgi:hypothetical protein
MATHRLVVASFVARDGAPGMDMNMNMEYNSIVDYKRAWCPRLLEQGSGEEDE